MEINFHAQEVDYVLNKPQTIRNLIIKVIKEESPEKEIGELNIIFTGDDYLLEINKKYLNHDYYTDIITFNYNTEEKIAGDLFISLDRVGENAKIYAKTFFNELHRVIIHGILHLLGYNDKTEKEKKIMRQKEDEHLQKLK